MRFLGIAVFIFVVSLFSVGNRPASAESISVSRTITVQARVLPAVYILIDKTGSIIEISSNSDQKARPIVFRERIVPENQLNLTSDIYKEYVHLITDKQIKAGVIYKKPPPVMYQPVPLTYTLAIGYSYS